MTLKSPHKLFLIIGVALALFAAVSFGVYSTTKTNSTYETFGPAYLSLDFNESSVHAFSCSERFDRCVFSLWVDASLNDGLTELPMISYSFYEDSSVNMPLLNGTLIELDELVSLKVSPNKDVTLRILNQINQSTYIGIDGQMYFTSGSENALYLGFGCIGLSVANFVLYSIKREKDDYNVDSDKQ